MNDMHPIERFQQECLTDNTRRERQALLLVSAIGIFIVKTGLIPTKISALGIEFSASNQQAMLKIIVAVVLYLLFAFCIHGFSDYMAWKTVYTRTLLDLKRQNILNAKSDEELQRDLDMDRNKALIKAHAQTPLPKARRPAVMARNIFDFGFPVVLALTAIVVVLTGAVAPR